jgi:hypothetical protein
VLRLGVGQGLFVQQQPAFAVAVAQAGEAVGDEAQPVDAAQVRRPEVGLVAVHGVQKVGVAGALQFRFQFRGAGRGLGPGPIAAAAGVDHREAFFLIVRASAVDGAASAGCRRGPVRSGPRRGCSFWRAVVAGGEGQQVQVVVAEHHDGLLAEGLDVAQHRQRLRAAVDQIADQPERVGEWVEADAIQQRAELVVATLDVADA